jgi:hypothetical protein
MSAPKGNRFWEVRSSHGRKPIFANPAALWDAACEYFQWVEDNPLQESKLFSFQGAISEGIVPKMRAMTKEGLCLFLDIDPSTWEDYKRKEDFSGIAKNVEAVIYQQKFSGAAADLLNPNIIARDLGLRDKSDVDHGIQANNPIADLIRQISGKTIDPNG